MMAVRSEVLLGDARDVLAGMDAASVDAIVTDPPAGIGFMGVAWDSYQTPKGGARSDSQWDWQGSKARPQTAYATARVARNQGRLFREAITPVFAECLRVLKPGHQALVWALPRTSHWTATALEDAGFYVADVVTHHFGSGFPKSRSLLKPASEHWILCRAPGPLQPLQIDACRVPTVEVGTARAYEPRQDREQWRITGGSNGSGATSPAGRWPANLALSHHPDCQPLGVRHVRGNGHHPAARGTGGLGTAGHSGQQGLAERHLNDEETPAYACVEGCPIKALDAQAGPRSSGANTASHNKPTPGWRFKGTATGHWPANTGSASRFFPTFPGPDPADAVPFRYVPKASRREREAGLDGAEPATKTIYGAGITSADHPGTADGGGPRPARNHHPCVKPRDLMAWLVTLVTVPGGVVLDPFGGSMSTGVACVKEGFSFIGIEMNPEYVAIGRARLEHAARTMDRQLAFDDAAALAACDTAGTGR